MGHTANGTMKTFVPEIKVVGVGGGGGNVINRMSQQGVQGVHLIVCNTDQQALKACKGAQHVLLGPGITGGQGAGANPDVGYRSALESQGELVEALKGAEMVFIAAGMGGGTGTGAAPVVAQVARATGALTVCMVTLPFAFEGRRRMNYAMMGLEALRKETEVMLVIPNDRLLTLTASNTSMLKAFGMADSVLVDAIQGISDLITHVGLINVDFADVRTILENKGGVVMGKGQGTGEHRLMKAAQAALENPLVGNLDIRGARGILAHVMGASNLSLMEVQEAMEMINHRAGADANLIFGATTNDNMGDEVSVTLIVTGLEQNAYNQYLGLGGRGGFVA